MISKKFKIITGSIVIFCLSACATLKHEMPLHSIKQTLFRWSDQEIMLNDRYYKGIWRYRTNGESFSLLEKYGGNPKFGWIRESHWGGTALLRSMDGLALRCEYHYNERDEIGIGICVDDQEAVYDLSIDESSIFGRKIVLNERLLEKKVDDSWQVY